MKTLIANQPLSGDYGFVVPGETFQAEDDVAKSLLARDLAKESDEPLKEAESDEDPDEKDDKGAAGRKTKEDKTVKTDNLA